MSYWGQLGLARRRFRFIIAFIAVIVLGVGVYLDVHCEWWRKFFSDHQVATGVTMTGFFILAGYLGLTSLTAARNATTGLAVNGLALAGLVRPILGVEWVLWGLTLGEDATLAERASEGTTKGTTNRAMKWTRPLMRATAPTVEARLNRLRTPRPDDGDTPTLHTQADLLDQCVREIAGSVRDWMPLLLQGDLGQDAGFCVQSLRVDLQLLEGIAAKNEGSPEVDLFILRERALLLVVAFEDASWPKNRRVEVEDAVRVYSEELPAKASIAEGSLLTHSEVARNYLKDIIKVGTDRGATKVLETHERQQRRLRANKAIREFATEQIKAVLDANKAKSRSRRG